MPAVVTVLDVLLTLVVPLTAVCAMVLTAQRRISFGALSAGAADEPATAVLPPLGGRRVDWAGLLVYPLVCSGLLLVLVALSSLLALGVGLSVQAATTIGTLITNHDARSRLALVLAEGVIGGLLLGGVWPLAERRAARAAADRDALARRLSFAAAFVVTAVLALFALHSLLAAVLTLPGPRSTLLQARTAVSAGARLLVFGLGWFVVARRGWRERGPRMADAAHDVAVYLLAAFALTFLSIGVGDGVRHLITAVQGMPQLRYLQHRGSWTWQVWGDVAAWTVAGGAVWSTIWSYDIRRGGRRLLRVLYLDAVLGVALFLAAVYTLAMLAETLKRLFGYHDPFVDNWSYVADNLPVAVVGLMLLVYHWFVLRQQAALWARPARAPGAIAWPRRLPIAVAVFAGLAMAASGAIPLLWLAIDALLKAHAAAEGGPWWRDPFSATLGLVVVGALIWLPTWRRLQRAAAADPQHERPAWERQLLLGAVALAGALATTGLAAATLYAIFRGILQTGDADTLADGLQDGSGAVIAAAVAAYHATLFVRDRRLRTPKPARVQVAALIAPDAGAALAQLTRTSGRQIEVTGQFDATGFAPAADLATLAAQLAALGREGQPVRAWLLVGAEGGILFPFVRVDEPRPRETTPLLQTADGSNSVPHRRWAVPGLR